MVCKVVAAAINSFRVFPPAVGGFSTWLFILCIIILVITEPKNNPKCTTLWVETAQQVILLISHDFKSALSGRLRKVNCFFPFDDLISVNSQMHCSLISSFKEEKSTRLLSWYRTLLEYRPSRTDLKNVAVTHHTIFCLCSRGTERTGLISLSFVAAKAIWKTSSSYLFDVLSAD